MATVDKWKNKHGETVYRITIADGIDSTGKQIRRRKTWTPSKPGMTEKAIQKELNRAIADFEREVEQGFQMDNKQTFSSYSAYVIDLKERTGVKPRTIDRYRELNIRTNSAIGHMKLSDIRPQHLNAFYKNLSEAGIREDGEKAVIKGDLSGWLKKNKISFAQIGRKAGISASTVSSAAHGNEITKAKAEAICEAIGRNLTDVFKIQKDTTPLSAKTILEYHRFISTVMAQAEKEMLIPFNPAAKATPPKQEQKNPDYYQPEEMDAILEALDKAPIKWRAITYLMIDTGCRRGEAMGLKWTSVDMNTGVITIERALLYSNKRGTYEGTTKTGKKRSLKLAPETLSILKTYRNEQILNRFKCGDRWIDTGYVFTQDNGDRMSPDSITDWLNKFSKKNNLPHIHPHAFRHTAASTMIAEGIDLVTTANELGHSSATTTANIYAHQISDAKAKAENVRAGVFARRGSTIKTA